MLRSCRQSTPLYVEENLISRCSSVTTPTHCASCRTCATVGGCWLSKCKVAYFWKLFRQGPDPTAGARPTLQHHHSTPPSSASPPDSRAPRPILPPSSPRGEATKSTMLLLDYQNVLIESLLRDRVNGFVVPRSLPLRRQVANSTQRSSRQH